MIYDLRQQRSVRAEPTQASIRSRPGGVPGIRDDAAESTRDADELTLNLPMLEAEVLELRENLAEVKANRDALRKEMDELRRDRDHWRKLAERGKPKPAAAQKAWFCGRAWGTPEAIIPARRQAETTVSCRKPENRVRLPYGHFCASTCQDWCITFQRCQCEGKARGKNFCGKSRVTH